MDQGSCQIGRVVGTSPPPSPGNSGRHSGQETIFGVFKLNFDSYESSQDFQTGVLHRISSRIYLAEWFGLGSDFEKIQNLASWAFGKSSKMILTTTGGLTAAEPMGGPGAEPSRQVPFF